jgi:Serpin (serine protease inhibitor)
MPCYWHGRVRFLEDFLRVTHYLLPAELALVDFIHESEAVRQMINTRIERQTYDNIKDFVPPAPTALIAINAGRMAAGMAFEPFAARLHRRAIFAYADHVCQLEGASPLPSLMEAKG